MKSDASIGDAYATADWGSPESELWVTFGLYLPAAALAYWAANGSPPRSGLLLKFDDGFNEFLQLSDFGSGLRWTDFWVQSTDPPTGDTCLTVEHHYTNGGPIQVYVDGVLVISTTDLNLSEFSSISLGQDLAGAGGLNPDPDEVVYIQYAKVGTVRGGSNLFSDDFSSGDFSAWSSTTGDVSVVSSLCGYTPIPPPDVVYSRVYGIQITLSDDGVEQVAQLVTSQDGFTA